MEDKKTELHPLLEKQLKRLNISADVLKSQTGPWLELLSRVSRCYYTDEQERYLLERSNEISSREMRELNDKLIEAQTIAHLGYWLYDRQNDNLMSSKETYRLFGLDPSMGIPKLEDFMQLIQLEDRKKLEVLIERAFKEGKEYEAVIRIKKFPDQNWYWSYIKGRPYHIPTDLKIQTRYLSGIIMDITSQKNTEFEMLNLHKQLIVTARQAGMSEVATSILHNVGNILNSVNISISLIRELIKNNHLKNFRDVSKILKNNANNNDYLIDDPKGKLIPDYLISLSNTLSEEFSGVDKEVKNLETNLKHIKDIVLRQKDISGLSGIIEKVYLSDVIDLVLQMICAASTCKDIEIEKCYEFSNEVTIDKAKLLQILVNLIKNAIDSLLSSERNSKRITIKIVKNSHKPFVEIHIQDNGIGISIENQIKIFSFGYTTKKTGHGFGLHSSAVAIKELGGNIRVDSEGIGKGATFTIEFPIEAKTTANEKSNT